jgi:hypothetical protein
MKISATYFIDKSQEKHGELFLSLKSDSEKTRENDIDFLSPAA